MKYYILEFDEKFNCIIDEFIPEFYDGISMDLGTVFKNSIPKIELTCDDSNLPNCIPNFQCYLYFDESIIQIIRAKGFNNFQLFDVTVNDENGKNIGSHKLVNILDVLDVIDRENSELEVDENDDSYIRDILKLSLDNKKIGDAKIFRLAGYETLLIVREDIAQELVNSNLTGFEFFDAEGYRI